MDNIQLRLAGEGDAAALALLGQATFLDTFAGILQGADILAHCQRQHAPELYRDWLANPDKHIWLAEVAPGAAPVGYLVLSPPDLPDVAPQAGDLEIKRIYLLHRFQGQRIGQRLMQAAFAHARNMGARRMLLGVYGENHAALAFYARCGFSVVGQRVFRVGLRDYHDQILGMAL